MNSNLIGDADAVLLFFLEGAGLAGDDRGSRGLGAGDDGGVSVLPIPLLSRTLYNNCSKVANAAPDRVLLLLCSTGLGVVARSKKYPQ